ncbi:MAG: hypothetical protein JXA03_03215 [Bacteroidales bacterium]|nr:hypothetical protein [Bacteroidales bacterium]
MRYFLFIISMALLRFGVLAQQDQPVDTSANIVMLKEHSFGIIFHSQGWGFNFHKGKNITAFSKRLLGFEFVEMKSPKQIRIINPYFSNSKSYVYGKLNTVYLLRAQYEVQKLLTRKPYWGGVELRFSYSGGASLGIAKPVYLYILTPTSDFFEYQITEEKYDPEAHFVDNIFGRAPLTRGMDEIGVYPGLHAKIGLSFDYGVYKSKVKTLDAGIALDVFPEPVPIMANNEPDYYFLTFYIGFSFGKRYN